MLSLADEEPLIWTVELEVNLFHAMQNHKPIGVNKHFEMATIQDKLNTSTSRHISAQQIWAHLVTLYDLNTLNELDVLPFPNTESEFALPDEFISGSEVKDNVETASTVSSTPDEFPPPRERHESGSSTRGSSKALDDSRSEAASPAPASTPSSAPSSAKRSTTGGGGEARKRTRNSLGTPGDSTPKRQRRS